MELLKKVTQRAADPIFYRKKIRAALRRFRTFGDSPRFASLEAIGGIGRVVLVVAHPDDETFCSGLLCDLVDGGATVDVLCLTRGEGGPTGEWSREELGRVRSEEMKEACRELGIGEPTFLEHPDPLARGYRVYAPRVAPSELAEQLRPHLADADLVVSHGSNGEYWHPAHILVHRAVEESLDSLPAPGPGWLTFLARQPAHAMPRLVNWDDRADLLLDVSLHADRRRRALERHRSQLSLFERFADGAAEDFLDATALESYCLRRRGVLQVAEAADEGEGHRCHAAHAGSEGGQG